MYDKNGEKIIDKKIVFKLNFLNSSIFMRDLLLNPLDNTVEEINRNNCEDCVDKYSECIEKNCKTKCNDYKCYPKYVEFKSKRVRFKCLKYNKNYK